MITSESEIKDGDKDANETKQELSTAAATAPSRAMIKYGSSDPLGQGRSALESASSSSETALPRQQVSSSLLDFPKNGPQGREETSQAIKQYQIPDQIPERTNTTAGDGGASPSPSVQLSDDASSVGVDGTIPNDNSMAADFKLEHCCCDKVRDLLAEVNRLKSSFSAEFKSITNRLQDQATRIGILEAKKDHPQSNLDSEEQQLEHANGELHSLQAPLRAGEQRGLGQSEDEAITLDPAVVPAASLIEEAREKMKKVLEEMKESEFQPVRHKPSPTVAEMDMPDIAAVWSAAET